MVGLIYRKLLFHWMFEHFLAYAPLNRPLLLILDGYSSHYFPEAIKVYVCAEEVITFALPPNTAHVVQPLGRGYFSAL